MKFSRKKLNIKKKSIKQTGGIFVDIKDDLDRQKSKPVTFFFEIIENFQRAKYRNLLNNYQKDKSEYTYLGQFEKYGHSSIKIKESIKMRNFYIYKPKEKKVLVIFYTEITGNKKLKGYVTISMIDHNIRYDYEKEELHFIPDQTQPNLNLVLKVGNNKIRNVINIFKDIEKSVIFDKELSGFNLIKTSDNYNIPFEVTQFGLKKEVFIYYSNSKITSDYLTLVFRNIYEVEDIYYVTFLFESLHFSPEKLGSINNHFLFNNNVLTIFPNDDNNKIIIENNNPKLIDNIRDAYNNFYLGNINLFTQNREYLILSQYVKNIEWLNLKSDLEKDITQILENQESVGTKLENIQLNDNTILYDKFIDYYCQKNLSGNCVDRNPSGDRKQVSSIIEFLKEINKNLQETPVDNPQSHLNLDQDEDEEIIKIKTKIHSYRFLINKPNNILNLIQEERGHNRNFKDLERLYNSVINKEDYYLSYIHQKDGYQFIQHNGEFKLIYQKEKKNIDELKDNHLFAIFFY